MADYRYNSSNNTAPAVQSMKGERPHVDYSFFDLSRMRHLNGTIGTIMPIDWLPVYPGDSLNLDYIIGLKLRNPLAKDALSGFKVQVHSYFCRSSDLWVDAPNFYSKGDSGDYTVRKPCIDISLPVFTTGTNFFNFALNTPMSLFDYLGVPSYAMRKDRARLYSGFGINLAAPLVAPDLYFINLGAPYYVDRDTRGSLYIDALPFALYQKIYISKYMNYNLVQDNRHFVPYDLRDLRIGRTGWSEGMYVNTLSVDKPFVGSSDVGNPAYIGDNLVITGENGDIYLNPDSSLFVPSSLNTTMPVALGLLRYRQFEGDYFTTASPFQDLIRGNIPEFSPAFEGGISFNLFNNNNGSTSLGTIYRPVFYSSLSPAQPTDASIVDNNNKPYSALDQETANQVLSDAINFDTLRAYMTMDDLYTIEALTLFRRRNAMTNGRYNELIRSQYGINPEMNEFEPIYLGGSTFDLYTTVVEQTSQSTSDSQLGERAGQLQGANYCRCGHITAQDFGYVMTVMSIIPDTYYSQGLPREFQEINQSDVPFPIFNQLPPDTISNSELFFSRNSINDTDIFAWKERFSQHKSRRNTVGGLMAMPGLDDSAYVSQRRFSDIPGFNNGFMTLSPGNVDMNIFSVTNEPPFIMSIGCDVKGRRAFPFATVPGGSLNPNLG